MHIYRTSPLTVCHVCRHPRTDLDPRDPLNYGGRDLEDCGGGFLREQRVKYCGSFLSAVAGDKHGIFVYSVNNSCIIILPILSNNSFLCVSNIYLIFLIFNFCIYFILNVLQLQLTLTSELSICILSRNN